MENRKCIQRMAVINGIFLRIFITCFFFYDSASAQLLSTPGGRILSTSSGKVLAAGATFSEVAILSISGVTDNTAIINATAISDGSTSITEKGLIWATSSLNLTYAANLGKKSFSGGAGNFNHALSALNPGTVYYVRAYVIVDGVTKYGAVRTFQTIPSAVAPFKCGDILTIKHTAGDVAPENVTINYKTVMTSLAGKSQCWITQNLGADNPANSLADASANAAGWYWKFNRKQGYDYQISAPTPGWVSETIDEISDWTLSNDPCSIELGSGWRIPTKQEWYDANEVFGGRISANNSFLSVLKLHAAGYLVLTNGQLASGTTVGSSSRGTMGMIWSSTNMSNINAYYWGINVSANSAVANYGKPYGLSVRCLKDNPVTPFNSCGDLLFVNHTQGNVAPETVQIAYGTVETNLAGSTQCWITQNLGAKTGASNLVDNSDAAAGWYWQFGRKQGYKVGPSPAWNTDLTSEPPWGYETDPCTIELGTGWRIPTWQEWSKVISAGGWNMASALSSELHLRAAGIVDSGNNGSTQYRGIGGWYWSIDQYPGYSHGAYTLSFNSTDAKVEMGGKLNAFSVRCVKNIAPSQSFNCGQTLTITHARMQDGVAPETITLDYKTILTNSGGTNQCWIAQNIGATRQALSLVDNTELSGGWYWKFNRKQAYKRGPSPVWDSDISSGGSAWLPENDPCSIEFGSSWRIPTMSEWNNVVTNLKTPYGAFGSELKFHASGWLSSSGGILENSGTTGYYWSSSYSKDSKGLALVTNTSTTKLESNVIPGAGYAFSVRCIKDEIQSVFVDCGDILHVIHSPTRNVAPEPKQIAYETVGVNTSDGKTQCWITQNLGANKSAEMGSDNNVLAIGWYWQFAQKQGYKYGPSPSWDGSMTIPDNSWDADNDPCQIELGQGWHVPTKLDWENVISGWTSYTDAYNSPLKLHTSGFMYYTNGALDLNSTVGNFWTGTGFDNETAYVLQFNELSSGVAFIRHDKRYGFALRCLKEQALPVFNNCGDKISVYHDTKRGVAPKRVTINYQTALGNAPNQSLCWITQNLGASTLGSSIEDYSREALGWYWAFNMKKGYEISIPGTVTNDTPDPGDWNVANDPCTIELGTGWHVPATFEWEYEIAGWTIATALKSPLYIRAAGTGTYPYYVGQKGYYWTNKQWDQSSGVASYYVSVSSTNTSVLPGGKSGGHSVRCVKNMIPTPFKKCGDLLTVNHDPANGVAPVKTTISYGTVLYGRTDLHQPEKCWITQNLGASVPATNYADNSEEASGWYWQFNRLRGYRFNYSLPFTSVAEDSDWLALNDPCSKELGAGWRIPTYNEWFYGTTGWLTYSDAFMSKLHLRPSGYIWYNYNNGTVYLNRIGLGDTSHLWTKEQKDVGYGNAFGIGSGYSTMQGQNKSYGLSIRCIKD